VSSSITWIGVAALLSVACGDEPTDPNDNVDSGVLDSGEAPPPPRRVLFVVQNSNSMGAVDPDERRKTLVEEAFAIMGESAFALIVFSDGYRESTFVADPESDTQIGFLLRRLETTENLGVLDGALRRAKEVLEEARAAETDPRIEWSVVILTDGFPTPSCTEANDISPLCETPRSEWGMFGVDLNDPSVYYGYGGAGGTYNRRADAVTRVQELAPLAKTHVILLYTEAIVGQPIEQSLGLNRSECASFVQELAAAGGGSAIVGDGAAIDWNVLLTAP
jgi:hypothetical protein